MRSRGMPSLITDMGKYGEIWRLVSVRVLPARASPEPWTGKIRDTCQKVQGVWIDRMLAEFRVDAAEDLHRPGPRYTILLIILHLKRHPLRSSFVDNYYSSLMECDYSRSVVKNAPVVGKQRNF